MSNPNFYVLLIGIDAYTPNPYYLNLGGCVRDINLVDQYIQQTQKPKKIWRLTAPLSDNFTFTPDPLPTYDNIVNTFKEITETAQKGDLVYFHYAGHGGRATTIFPEVKKGEMPNDEGIVPMDVGTEGRYLRDVEMATLLKRMTDKGLIVTVVLDSCHSGGAARGDVQIRGSQTIDVAPRSSDSKVASRQELLENWQILTQNSSQSYWMPEGKDYVLLAACRPTEFAYEYAVLGSDRHGALTYWLVNTLNTTEGALSYRTLHNRVTAQIQAKFPQQLPMILGDSDRLVFGSEDLASQYTVSVLEVDETKGIVTLNAGLAQGLSKGTRFAIYPLTTIHFSEQSQIIAMVEVAKVEAGSSLAKILTSEAGGVVSAQKIERGYPAVMTQPPIDLVSRICLFEKPEGDKDGELPQPLFNQQKTALAVVREALQGNGWLTEVSQDEGSLFQLAVALDGTYEIAKGSPLKNLRPALKINDSEAAKKVIERLVHLTKYQAVLSLNNNSSSLSKSLKVELLDELETPFFNLSEVTIKNEAIVILRITNTGSQDLKIAVLDIEPTWAISQIPIDGLVSAFFNLAGGDSNDIKLRLALPNDAEYQEAIETLKVIAIRKGIADFRWLTLPALDQPMESRSVQLRGELERIKSRSVTRGEEAISINSLNHLMEKIGADPEDSPNVTRAAIPISDSKDDWVTEQISVKVTRL